MSDVAIWALTVTVAVFTVCYFARWMYWMRLSAAEKVRAEQRDERDTGVIAQTLKRMDVAEKAVSDMRTEQKTFLANARSR